MNQWLETIFSYFPAEWGVSGTFVMKNKTIPVKHQPLRHKSIWKPLKGHESLEVFLSRLEKVLF